MVGGATFGESSLNFRLVDAITLQYWILCLIV